MYVKQIMSDFKNNGFTRLKGILVSKAVLNYSLF